jgi:hypothetical protein
MYFPLYSIIILYYIKQLTDILNIFPHDLDLIPHHWIQSSPSVDNRSTKKIYSVYRIEQVELTAAEEQLVNDCINGMLAQQCLTQSDVDEIVDAMNRGEEPDLGEERPAAEAEKKPTVHFTAGGTL